MPEPLATAEAVTSTSPTPQTAAMLVSVRQAGRRQATSENTNWSRKPPAIATRAVGGIAGCVVACRKPAPATTAKAPST